MKNRVVLFVAGCIALVLSSCMGSDDYEYVVPTDCLITSFVISHEDVLDGGLSSVAFAIDQVNGRIFNPDSLPYGTVIKNVHLKITHTDGMASLQATSDAKPDSTFYWTDKVDSVDFSMPIRFLATSHDGNTQKIYRAQINIHQTIPDSMHWNLAADKLLDFPIASQKVITWNEGEEAYYYMYAQAAEGNKAYSLHRSPVADGENWTALSLTGLPAEEIAIAQLTEYEGELFVPTISGALYHSADGQEWTLFEQEYKVKSLLGAIKAIDNIVIQQLSFMSALVEKEGKLHFATMHKGMKWTVTGEVPEDFPVSGFGSISTFSFGSKHNSLLLVAGRDKNNRLINTSWATMSGLQWVKLTDDKTNYFDNREGVMLSYYDDKLFMIGGINEKDEASREIYLSNDGGLTWHVTDTLVRMPVAFKGRGYGSIAVDEDKFMYVFGGKTTRNGHDTNELWKGRINRLGYKD